MEDLKEIISQGDGTLFLQEEVKIGFNEDNFNFK